MRQVNQSGEMRQVPHNTPLAVGLPVHDRPDRWSRPFIRDRLEMEGNPGKCIFVRILPSLMPRISQRETEEENEGAGGREGGGAVSLCHQTAQTSLDYVSPV